MFIFSYKERIRDTFTWASLELLCIENQRQHKEENKNVYISFINKPIGGSPMRHPCGTPNVAETGIEIKFTFCILCTLALK